MNSRQTIVVLDPFASVDRIEAILGKDAEHFEVVAAVTLPTSGDVFAVLLGPETPITGSEVANLTGLRIVSVSSTGFDHVPVHAVTAAGAWVSTAAGYCTDEVAEHALALILGGLRGVPALDASVRRGKWDVTLSRPKRIRGAVVGLVGFGRIAQAVAGLLRPLGVVVKAYDPWIPDDVFERFGVSRAQSIETALQNADAVSLHVPLIPETVHLIDSTRMAILRRGTFLVNVARGSLIDTDAVCDAIESGQLSGAALDVFQEEPLPMDARVRQIARVLLSPHGAWYSDEAEERLFTMATESILDVFHGRTPAGAVAAPAI
ncbi:NAD(P)-dependent oxidoreductase [Cryobacterium sp. CG_9.6]|uniref:NAD(P)-dependent oxidoreductase n=1 Tax=Cryobacterium sp. CG_9.6 TaxID=2760710 RepID=UPI00247546D2|nr:NAD(P)-dependent oxidoreductase [Cryobacterium sp. CG_9.6]MDH6236738.1 D-3-phosphoglycerate dehydrogenase [Cryobacterium sp. CG_9.6]